MPKLCFFCLFFVFVNFAQGQSALPEMSIVPQKDLYYLKNWNLKGHVKSVFIKSHKPRNPATRYNLLDDCRMTAQTSERFAIKEDRYDFNKQGQLIKHTDYNTSGKIITLFTYNIFGKISIIDSEEKSLQFKYDFVGNLIGTDSFRGAKMASQTNRICRGDSVISVTNYFENMSSDSLIEIVNDQRQTVYSAIKIPSHPLKENFFEYDSEGRLIRTWNNLNVYFEYEYDSQNRIIRNYIGRDKSLLISIDYGDGTGIVKTTRSELISGQYVLRNYECLCTAIDGQNNPIKSEYIDCSNSPEGDSFSLNGFFVVTYDYFK